MLRLAVLFTAAFTVCVLPLDSQQPNATEPGRKSLMVPTVDGARPVAVSAISRSGTQYPSTMRLAGNVEIKTPVCIPTGPNGRPVCDGYMILRADEAVLHEDTGEIEASGNVRVTALRPEP